MSIQVFACDHRKNVKWDLPYIRIGCPGSDALLISEDDEITPFLTLLSEGALIWWVWKHLKIFDNPDYVGFCHYRRFFSLAALRPIINIDESQFNPQYCLNPLLQEAIIKKFNADGIVFHPLNAVNCKVTGCKNIIDLLKWLSDHDKLGIPYNICDIAFQLLLTNTPDNLKKYMENAILEELMYACNIFTLKRSLFEEYCRIVIPTSKAIYDHIDKALLKFIHPRFIGYILERLTSCYLHAILKSGVKLITLPLMTINGERHVHWEAPAR